MIRQDSNILVDNFDKGQKDLLAKISKECTTKHYPASPLTEDDLDSIQVYQTSLKDYCSSMMEKFVNGSEPLSNWDKFVEQCKAKGCDKLVETYNNALKNKYVLIYSILLYYICIRDCRTMVWQSFCIENNS